MKNDLRSFLKAVEEGTPELLVRVKKEVSPRWEASAVQRKLESEEKLPVPTFQKTNRMFSTAPRKPMLIS